MKLNKGDLIIINDMFNYNDINCLKLEGYKRNGLGIVIELNTYNTFEGSCVVYNRIYFPKIKKHRTIECSKLLTVRECKEGKGYMLVMSDGRGKLDSESNIYLSELDG